MQPFARLSSAIRNPSKLWIGIGNNSFEQPIFFHLLQNMCYRPCWFEKEFIATGLFLCFLNVFSRGQKAKWKFSPSQKRGLARWQAASACPYRLGKQFKELKQALSIFIDDETDTTIWQVLGALIHLGALARKNPPDPVNMGGTKIKTPVN